MKLFLEIITNPFGLAINVVHWTLVMIAYFLEGNPFEKKTALCFHCHDYPIFDFLMNVNFLPFVLIEIIAQPINLLFVKNDFIDIHLQFLLIFIIITQWFLVGFLFSLIVDKFKSDKIQTPFN